MVRPLALDRALALRVDASGADAVTMVSDARALRQVLLNLLTNAIKYTPVGQITLTVHVEPPAPVASHGVAPEAPRPTVVLQVADTGIGIAPEHQARIFEPFWQVAPALTRAVGGTGLGLSVTRDLVHALGGTLTVASASGAGSTFTVRLPLA
jgi:signal transduction histidine kinase